MKSFEDVYQLSLQLKGPAEAREAFLGRSRTIMERKLRKEYTNSEHIHLYTVRGKYPFTLEAFLPDGASLKVEKEDVSSKSFEDTHNESLEILENLGISTAQLVAPEYTEEVNSRPRIEYRWDVIYPTPNFDEVPQGFVFMHDHRHISPAKPHITTSWFAPRPPAEGMWDHVEELYPGLQWKLSISNNRFPSDKTVHTSANFVFSATQKQKYGK